MKAFEGTGRPEESAVHDRLDDISRDYGEEQEVENLSDQVAYFQDPRLEVQEPRKEHGILKLNGIMNSMR